MNSRERILVLDFSALGDVVQSFAPLQQIRQAHPQAEITVLTTPPYGPFIAASGLFDIVETDGRPRELPAILAMLRRLRRRRYRRVYDLQTSSRSKLYFYGFLPWPPQWSGISRGASHRQTRPDRDALHNLDRWADQLHVAGIAPAYPPGQAPAPRLDWAVAAAGDEAALLAKFGLRKPFALLAPGASRAKPEKRWPPERYAAVAQGLQDRGILPVVIGTEEEAPQAKIISQAVPQAIDLTGRTSLVELAGLAAQARFVLGNDSGPTHLLAYAGAPGLMLMSKVSDPNHCAPRARMQTLRIDDLTDLSHEEVLRRLIDG